MKPPPGIAILFLLSSAAFAAGPETLTAVQACGSTDMRCLLMEVSLPRHRAAQGEKRADGYSRFAVPLKGRFGAGPVGSYVLSLTGYTDGIACDSFGQAKVAVRGMTGGHPLVQTSRGDLELVDEALEVGCKDCLWMVDKKSGKLLAAYRTPSRDLTLAGVPALFVDPKAAAWVQVGTPSQGRCVALTQKGEYKAAQESYACLRDGLYKVGGRESPVQHDGTTYRRYDLDALPFYVDLVNQSCS